MPFNAKVRELLHDFEKTGPPWGMRLPPVAAVSRTNWTFRLQSSSLMSLVKLLHPHATLPFCRLRPTTALQRIAKPMVSVWFQSGPVSPVPIAITPSFSSMAIWPHAPLHPVLGAMGSPPHLLARSGLALSYEMTLFTAWIAEQGTPATQMCPLAHRLVAKLGVLPSYAGI